MPRQNSNNRPGNFAAGPLYGRADRNREPRPVPRPTEEILLPPRAVIRGGGDEMRMCRHTNPIPNLSSATETEVACILRRQTELLTEILCALHSLTALQLSSAQRAE